MLKWLQSFVIWGLVYAIALCILVWFVMQDGEVASTAVFIVILMGSVIRQGFGPSG